MDTDKILCTIDLSRNHLDDIYTIYENGKIKHLYDANIYRLNIEEWVEPSNITDPIKKKILDKCSVESRAQIENILFLK